jgi:GNAT superfamily N-acetyltransferase
VAVEIRHAHPDEAEDLLRAYEWLFAPPGQRPPGWDREAAVERLRHGMDLAEAAILIAVSDREIVGLCTAYDDMLSVRYGRRVWVEDLAVDPDVRGQGIGKALLDAAKGWARERGASHLELDSAETRADAHRFYEREGASYRAISFGWQL